jgi:hypothetical protein
MVRCTPAVMTEVQGLASVADGQALTSQE